MLGNCFKILRTTSNSSNLLIARNYAFKSELKIKWNRPEKISCIKPEKSGDLKKLENVDQSRYMLGYEKSEELKEYVVTILLNMSIYLIHSYLF